MAYGGAHHALLHVGLYDGDERCADPAPQSRLHAELVAEHAGAVLLLWGVFSGVTGILPDLARQRGQCAS